MMKRCRNNVYFLVSVHALHHSSVSDHNGGVDSFCRIEMVSGLTINQDRLTQQSRSCAIGIQRSLCPLQDCVNIRCTSNSRYDPSAKHVDLCAGYCNAGLTPNLAICARNYSWY